MLWHVVVPLDAVSEDSDCHLDEKTWLCEPDDAVAVGRVSLVEHVDLVRSMEAYSALHIHCRTDGIMRKMCQWNVRFVIGNANFARPFSEFVPVLGV